MRRCKGPRSEVAGRWAERWLWRDRTTLSLVARGGVGEGPPAEAKPVQPYEALPEEKAAVKEYALKHPELRHRELAWRMVDEDVAYLGASTVYRILREAKLVCPWRRRSKRRREKTRRRPGPDEIWATDIKYVWVGERTISRSLWTSTVRYIVHELVGARMALS
jgi:transposase InsO family protein